MSELNANTRFALTNAGHVVNQLLDHFVEHADVHRQGSRAKLVLSFGQADVQWDDETVSVDVSSEDETGLAYMKYSIAEHVLEFLDKGSAEPKIIWEGDGAAGLPLPYFREMQVVSVSNVTPHMRRVRLKGENLFRFSQLGLHIRLLFPPEGLAKPQWPTTGEDGRPVWPEGAAKLATRVYTIRNIDTVAGWVDIDMVVHGDDCDAPGSGWALGAKPGDIVGMTGPGAAMQVMRSGICSPETKPLCLPSGAFWNGCRKEPRRSCGSRSAAQRKSRNFFARRYRCAVAGPQWRGSRNDDLVAGCRAGGRIAGRPRRYLRLGRL